jgi:excinuclease UvrABC nuclease subunit
MSKIQSKSKIISKAIPLTKPIKGIYFLIYKGVIVYVGQSSNITFRLSVHVSNRKKEFDSYSYIESNEVNLNNLEANYIYEFAPYYNKRLPPNDIYRRVKKNCYVEKVEFSNGVK